MLSVQPKFDACSWESGFGEEAAESILFRKKENRKELCVFCVSVLQAHPQHATNETSQCIGATRPCCKGAPSQITFRGGLESRSPIPWPSAHAVKCPRMGFSQTFCAHMQRWTQAPSPRRRWLTQVGSQLWVFEDQGSVPTTSVVCPTGLVSW